MKRENGLNNTLLIYQNILIRISNLLKLLFNTGQTQELVNHNYRVIVKYYILERENCINRKLDPLIESKSQ